MAGNSESGSATLVADDLRIKGDFPAAVNGASFTSSVGSVLLVGAWDALAHLVRGEEGLGNGGARSSKLVSGSLHIAGAPVVGGTPRHHVSWMHGDLTALASLTVERYLFMAARIGGLDRKATRARVKHALAEHRIKSEARTTIGRLSKGAQLLTSLAAARIIEPTVVWIDRAFDHCSIEQSAEALALIDTLDTDGQRFIGTTNSAESPLAALPWHTLHFARDATAIAVAPADESSRGHYELEVIGDGHALAQALTSAGAQVEAKAPGDAQPWRRFWLYPAAPISISEILEVATSQGVVVVHCRAHV